MEVRWMHLIMVELLLHMPLLHSLICLQEVQRIKQAAEAEGAAQNEAAAKASSGREAAAEELAALKAAEAEARQAVKDAKTKGGWVDGWFRYSVLSARFPLVGGAHLIVSLCTSLVISACCCLGKGGVAPSGWMWGALDPSSGEDGSAETRPCCSNQFHCPCCLPCCWLQLTRQRQSSRPLRRLRLRRRA
jgi:hypothetical protein